MNYLHGTTDAVLESVLSRGILPPASTDHSTEKRSERLNRVHLLEDTHLNIAGAYAIRAALHWGGEPIILGGELNDSAVELAIKGKRGFPDIYTIAHVPPAYIEVLGTVRDLLDTEDAANGNLNSLYKRHK